MEEIGARTNQKQLPNKALVDSALRTYKIDEAIISRHDA
jgi:hypothetical protein